MSWYAMNPAIQSGMFMPSETAIISDSVLDLEFSFWTLELEIKFPTPNVTHIPEVDFICSLLANAASIDTVTVIGKVQPSRNGLSLVALR